MVFPQKNWITLLKNFFKTPTPFFIIENKLHSGPQLPNEWTFPKTLYVRAFNSNLVRKSKSSPFDKWT